MTTTAATDPTTEYAVLLPGDERRWFDVTAEQRAEVHARHVAFAAALAERGHTITGGAHLTPSTGAKVVRGRTGDVTVTDGPYAETVEQLTGFYLVRTADLDDLLDVCALLADGDGAVEVRACMPAAGDD